MTFQEITSKHGDTYVKGNSLTTPLWLAKQSIEWSVELTAPPPPINTSAGVFIFGIGWVRNFLVTTSNPLSSFVLSKGLFSASTNFSSWPFDSV